MSVVLLSRDLATASRVEGAAMRQRVSLRTVGSAELAAAVSEELHASLVIVDLTTPALEVVALIATLKRLTSPPSMIAFGPHVHEAVLAAAKAAGCDEVVSRGQFFAQLDEIVGRAAGPQ